MLDVEEFFKLHKTLNMLWRKIGSQHPSFVILSVLTNKGYPNIEYFMYCYICVNSNEGTTNPVGVQWLKLMG